MKTILLRGNTFAKRREIRRLGGVWNKDFKGWLVPLVKTDKISDLAYSNGYYIEETEVDFDPFKPMTIDELRAYRQSKADRKAERLERWAESRERTADELDKQVKPFVSDWSFVTQPITNNSGGRSFARFREKITAKIDRMFELCNEADELRERAESIRSNVIVKGDAERKRQATRDANDKIVKVGSRVFSYSFGDGEVVKVNKISYSVKIDRLDSVLNVDKCYVKLLEG